MIQRGVRTPQDIPHSGRRFLVEDSPPPCYRDRWGTWHCGHPHDGDPTPLQDAYESFEGWTAQHVLMEPS